MTTRRDFITTAVVAGTTAGLAIGMLTYSGLRIYDDYRQRTKSPDRWLSRITSAQRAEGLLACPLGLDTDVGRRQKLTTFTLRGDVELEFFVYFLPPASSLLGFARVASFWVATR